MLRKVPQVVGDNEVLVRAILSPYHLHKKNKNCIVGKAFEAPPDNDEVSVSRGYYVPEWLSKAYAKAWVQRPDANPQKLYRGLAFISVRDVRKVESSVKDSRKEYLGHADIIHGVVKKRGEALDPRIRKSLEEKLEKLAEAARYIEDPNPHSLFWERRIGGK